MTTKQTEIINYGEFANQGFDGVTSGDMQVPFLKIIQDGSGTVKQGDPKYIKGAFAGQVLNTVTNELIEARESEKASLTVIPCGFKKAYVEWRPKSKGGGLISVHEDPSIMQQTRKGESEIDKNKDFLPNGNQIVTTAYHSVLLINKGVFTPCVIAMKDTQLKHSRNWLTQMSSLKMVGKDGKSFTPPMFAYHWKLSTVIEKNNIGSWFNWKIERGELVKEFSIFTEAKELANTVSAGRLALKESNETQDETVDIETVL